jgi:hypothetical protein
MGAVFQLGRITLNVAKVPMQMERQRRRERMEEALKESSSRGEGLMAKILAQVPLLCRAHVQMQRRIHESAACIWDRQVIRSWAQ